MTLHHQSIQTFVASNMLKCLSRKLNFEAQEGPTDRGKQEKRASTVSSSSSPRPKWVDFSSSFEYLNLLKKHPGVTSDSCEWTVKVRMTGSRTGSKRAIRGLCRYGNCVCSGGLFDDQFQEFGFKICLRFKESRRKKGQEERKKEGVGGGCRETGGEGPRRG